MLIYQRVIRKAILFKDYREYSDIHDIFFKGICLLNINKDM